MAMASVTPPPSSSPPSQIHALSSTSSISCLRFSSNEYMGYLGSLNIRSRSHLPAMRCSAREVPTSSPVLPTPQLQKRIVGRGSKLIGCGSATPKHVISNDELSKIVDTSDEWISVRTGIRNRRGLSDDLAADMQDVVSTMPREVHLRLDALDMQRDFRGRPLRPLLDVDTPTPVSRSKPGKRQNVPPKARRMILSLRDLPVEDFATALKNFKSIGPERADWLYVLRYFREKEDKSMLLEVFNFVLLQSAFKASARDYTNLIRVFAQLKNHEAVERTLKVMVEREVFPDLVTYTVVIGMYGKLGDLDMVKSKFNELKVYGLVPDTIIYCAVVEAYSQLGYAVEAELFVEVMERAELPLKIEIFISLIRGYGNLGQVVDAERVFQLMQAKLLYPERRSYSALMDAYTKDEDVMHAIQVFNNMVDVGIEPTDKSLARLLIACEKKNRLQEAMEIVEKLESKSFKFGTNMLVSFGGWLAKLRLEKEVELMSSEVEKRLEQKAYVAKKWSPHAYVPASYSI